MDRTSFINMYSRFDTSDIAERIADKINQYIGYDGIENLPYREIHGRHTGYLDISSGGFRNDYDFLCPVLNLCRVDCRGVVMADIRKIDKHLDKWRTSLVAIPDEELEYLHEEDFCEDDDLYIFCNSAYNAELDSFMKLDSPSPEEIESHEEAIEDIWYLSSDVSKDSLEEDLSSSADQSDESVVHSDSPFKREYDADGWPIHTKEEIEIYEQALEDMDKKNHSLLNRCREIFYGEGKEALNTYLNDIEEYSTRHHGSSHRYDDPMYFPDYEISRIRERFDVWDEEKERLRWDNMMEKMQEDVEDYWNDPNRENSDDWVSPTSVQDLKDYFEEECKTTTFAEFVSLVRRGEFGILPDDYDGLAAPGEPGYYGDVESGC